MCLHVSFLLLVASSISSDVHRWLEIWKQLQITNMHIHPQEYLDSCKGKQVSRYMDFIFDNSPGTNQLIMVGSVHFLLVRIPLVPFVFSSRRPQGAE
ncbi:hypothetical protein PMAYCL1PPCAC_19025, partial [Pristionchus mayeri]